MISLIPPATESDISRSFPLVYYRVIVYQGPLRSEREFDVVGVFKFAGFYVATCTTTRSDILLVHVETI